MRSSSANPSAGAERALSPAGAAGAARPAPAGLAFREIDESPAGLAALGRFYRERYVAAFPDPDERESLANMRHYLALKAAGWYGPNNYHAVIAEVDGEPVGGVVFDYLAAPNAGVVEFLFVAGAFRGSGLGRALLDEAISILRDDALARRGRRLTAVVAEMNDPFHRPATPDNLDPFLRAAIWGRWGFHALGFPYVQPALSADQQKAVRAGLPSYAKLRAEVRAAEEPLMKKFEDGGGKVIRLTDAQRKAWFDKVYPGQAAYVKTLGGESQALYDLIQKARQDYAAGKK